MTPPAYTGRAPIFLTGEAAKPPGTEYSVPVGSVVTVRTGGTHDLAVMASDDGGKPAPVAPAAAQPGRGQRCRRAARASGDARQRRQRHGGEVRPRDRRLELRRRARQSAADRAGRRAARRSAAARWRSPIRSQDDYGVVAARGEIAPLADPATGDARPLYEAPALPLSLPQLRVRDGTGETIRDLTSHPWAGAKVKLTLVATDEAKQEGKSAPIEFTLPARHFTNPLARAVVEQRARLALDANAADRVADALDALTVAPENIDGLGNYLALRTAYFRLVQRP